MYNSFHHRDESPDKGKTSHSTSYNETTKHITCIVVVCEQALRCSHSSPTLVPSEDPDRRNVTPVSNASDLAPISLFWPPDGLNELSEKSRICRQPDWKVDNGLFNRPIVTHTQIILNKNFGAVAHKWKFSPVLG